MYKCDIFVCLDVWSVFEIHLGNAIWGVYNLIWPYSDGFLFLKTSSVLHKLLTNLLKNMRCILPHEKIYWQLHSIQDIPKFDYECLEGNEPIFSVDCLMSEKNRLKVQRHSNILLSCPQITSNYILPDITTTSFEEVSTCHWVHWEIM